MSYYGHEYSESECDKYNDKDLCEYCGDKPAYWDGVYCGGYCHYRDTQVVPKKQAMIKRIVEIQAEARKTDPDWSILRSLKNFAKVQEVPKNTYTECEKHEDVKVGEKRKYCCISEE
jgi:hypothetical protein